MVTLLLNAVKQSRYLRQRMLEESGEFEEFVDDMYSLGYGKDDVDIDLDTCLYFIQQGLSQCEYTLSPGKTEDGEDFIEDFLITCYGCIQNLHLLSKLIF